MPKSKKTPTGPNIDRLTQMILVDPEARRRLRDAIVDAFFEALAAEIRLRRGLSV